MTIKEIVEKYWRDFEIIAFKAVKSSLPRDITIGETLTQAIKDGGYDGEFILLSRDDAAFRVVFEAKLRSNTMMSLPLNDFAKALVIAVVRQADMIYVVTNLHFSANTISILEDYARSVPLEIQLLNGYSVKEFIQLNEDILEDVNIELKHFLLSQKNVHKAQSLGGNAPFWEKQNISLYDKTKHTEEYRRQIRIFDKVRGTMLVTGSVGSGKSHFIEGFYHVAKYEGRTACLIDLSTCITYKDLFLKITEKALGLSLELVDLLDEQSFTEAFSSMGVSNANEEDMRMLKYVFLREYEYPFDYSFLFEKIANFFYKIFSVGKRHIIIFFTNLVYAQKEVLQLLLCLLNKGSAFSCVLEIANDDFWDQSVGFWAGIKQVLFRHASLPSITIKEWTAGDAKRFLQEHTQGLTDRQIGSLVQRFGRTPAELSGLIELIDYSDLYKNTPKELVYREICTLDSANNDLLYGMCLEYMQYSNSDIAYIYAFIYLLCGEVKLNFLLLFFENRERFEKSMNVLRRSHLFIVNGQILYIKNKRIERYFLTYCTANLYTSVVSQVAEFIERNFAQFHLSDEKVLELGSRVAYFENMEKCVEYLVALGDTYLSMDQLELAERRYRKAYELEMEYPTLRFSMLTQIRIRLGLVETLIWKIGSHRDEIVEYLDSAQRIVSRMESTTLEYRLPMLRFFRLAYQFHHAQNERKPALHYAQQGIKLIEDTDLHILNLEECGKMYRFYAVAVKEDTQDISECLKAFERGKTRCSDSAKFQFGYIIHKNMTVDNGSDEKRIQAKLDNYTVLYSLDKKLSIDEYLHYRTNVAALHFLKKEYDIAWEEYQKLLEKSAIFNIVREEVRILNDMANICWIRGDLEEAQKKYHMGMELAKTSGCIVNYWPLLVNMVSYEVCSGNHIRAWELSKVLHQYLIDICLDIAGGKLSIERKEYCCAALKIQVHNLWDIYQQFGEARILDDIIDLLERSCLCEHECIERENMAEIISGLEPRGTIFNHNGIYLLKD